MIVLFVVAGNGRFSAEAANLLLMHLERVAVLHVKLYKLRSVINIDDIGVAVALRCCSNDMLSIHASGCHRRRVKKLESCYLLNLSILSLYPYDNWPIEPILYTIAQYTLQQ